MPLDPDTAGTLLTVALLMLAALLALVANRGPAETLSNTEINPQSYEHLREK